MRTLGLGVALWWAGLRSALQYRTDTFIIVVMALVFQGTGFAFAWVVLTRFESIGGWTLGEIAFLYGLRLVVHAVAGVLAGPFFGLQEQVRSGEFDRYLVRPVSPLLQFMTQRVQVSIIGDLLGGVAVFLGANTLIRIDWSPLALLFLALAILGGAFVELASRILVGALSFRFLASASVLYLADSLFSTYGNYPLTVFGSALSAVFTFVVPLAIVAYFPATVLLDRTAELQVSPVIAYLTPLIGIVWLAISIQCFRRQMGHYQSAGH